MDHHPRRPFAAVKLRLILGALAKRTSTARTPLYHHTCNRDGVRQTQGQPWLVNALSERACFRGEASCDCTRPITEPAILDAQEQLILAQRQKLKTSEESLCQRHV